MGKRTKLVAVLSAAALLTVDASMTSFAAQGQIEAGGTWVYLDKDGYKVTDNWKKSGNFQYYLDEDGYMATSKLIENGDSNNNTHYVDETDRTVTNDWIELKNENYYDGANDDEPKTVYYYFQSSGKAYKTSGSTSLKSIDSKRYAFGEDGHMLWGQVGDTSSRCPDDDGCKTGGACYCDDSNDDAGVSGDWRYLYIGTENRTDDSEDDTYWFYFDASGKKVYMDEEYMDTRTPSDSVFKTKKINGETYAFDTESKMINKWSVSTVATANDTDDYYSTSDDGTRRKGWFQAAPSASINPTANIDDGAKWFYADDDGSSVCDTIKTISNKEYAFDSNGEMLGGLQALKADNNVTEDYYRFKEKAAVDHIRTCVPIGWDVYYFGDNSDGAMKTSSQDVDVDDERYQFSFGRSGAGKGKGVNAPQGNALYSHGERIKADNDYRYQVFGTDGKVVITMTEGSAVTFAGYLVNTSGSIMKGSGLYTDSDGRQFRVNKNLGIDAYIITLKRTKD